MERISQSLVDIREHVKEKFECTDCCTLMCWSICWVGIYAIVTCAMIITVSCQLLLHSEIYELFPRKSNVPYYMAGMILLQFGVIILYSVAISEQSDKLTILVMIYLVILIVLFVGVAILTRMDKFMTEEEKLSDAKFLHTMRYHFHTFRYMAFWVTFQKNYECCGVKSWEDWKAQTSTMEISGGCCRVRATKTTKGSSACTNYGMRFAVLRGCSRKLFASRPFQVTRLMLFVVAIGLAILHVPGIVCAFVLRRRFYVLYYFNYDEDDYDDDDDYY